jgi:midasin
LLTAFQNIFPVLKAIRAFWWDLFEVVDSASMEEAVFQIHLSLGRKDLVEARTMYPNGADFLSAQLELLHKMTSSSGLTTGKSMELLWKTFRPPTVSTIEHLDSLLHLESLADRFDSRTFPLRAPLDSLCQIRETFGLAIRTATLDNVDIEDLIKELEIGISGMETAQVKDTNESSTTFFGPHFEAICQYFSFTTSSTTEVQSEMRNLLARASLLAQRPTKRNSVAAREGSALPHGQRLLLSVDVYVGEPRDAADPSALRQNLQLSLARKLYVDYRL